MLGRWQTGGEKQAVTGGQQQLYTAGVVVDSGYEEGEHHHHHRPQRRPSSSTTATSSSSEFWTETIATTDNNNLTMDPRFQTMHSFEESPKNWTRKVSVDLSVTKGKPRVSNALFHPVDVAVKVNTPVKMDASLVRKKRSGSVKQKKGIHLMDALETSMDVAVNVNTPSTANVAFDGYRPGETAIPTESLPKIVPGHATQHRSER
eukprot:sb/3470458/